MDNILDVVSDIKVSDIFNVERNLMMISDTDVSEKRFVNYNGAEVDAVEVYKWLWRCFADEIARDKYRIFPTMTEFRRWLVRQAGGKTSKKLTEIAELYIDRYFPKCTAWVKSLQADIINEGAAKKYYDKTASIFALKNICGWSDNNKDASGGTGPIQINISVIK